MNYAPPALPSVAPRQAVAISVALNQAVAISVALNQVPTMTQWPRPVVVVVSVHNW